MKTSVALCTYNGEKYLKEQIDSILNQSLLVDEFVICDDRSTDNTIAILNDYKVRFPELFKIHINEATLKSTLNFQKALRLCSNEVIFLSDQDDLWQKDKVREFVDVFMENADIDVIASNGNFYDGEVFITDRHSVWDIPYFIGESGIHKPNYFEIISAITNISTGSAMAIRKKFIKNIPSFPEIENMYHDEYIALIAARENKFYFLDKKLFSYRIHNEQQVGLYFFNINKINIDYLLKPYKRNKTFTDYKQLLKLISTRYKKHSNIVNFTKLDPYYYELFESMRNTSKSLFNKNQLEMKNKFPIKSFILRLLDYLTKKRTL